MSIRASNNLTGNKQTPLCAQRTCDLFVANNYLDRSRCIAKVNKCNSTMIATP
jgi:hypothetical protein